ncbi:MAG: hypothetical protein ABIZ07_08460, partial [Dermatophilaceae bacterium]
MNPLPQIHHFAQGNPEGQGQGDVPSMLRRAADSIEALGVVTVMDLTFANVVTADGLWPHVTAYFHYGEMDEQCICGLCV